MSASFVADSSLCRGLSRIGVVGMGPEGESIAASSPERGFAKADVPGDDCDLLIMLNGVLKCGGERTLRILLTTEPHTVNAGADAVITVSAAEERRLFDALVASVKDPCIMGFDYSDFAMFFKQSPSKRFYAFAGTLAGGADCAERISSRIQTAIDGKSRAGRVLFFLSACKGWGLKEIDGMIAGVLEMVDGPLIYSVCIDDRPSGESGFCAIFN